MSYEMKAMTFSRGTGSWTIQSSAALREGRLELSLSMHTRAVLRVSVREENRSYQDFPLFHAELDFYVFFM